MKRYTIDKVMNVLSRIDEVLGVALMNREKARVTFRNGDKIDVTGEDADDFNSLVFAALEGREGVVTRMSENIRQAAYASLGAGRLWTVQGSNIVEADCDKMVQQIEDSVRMAREVTR